VRASGRDRALAGAGRRRRIVRRGFGMELDEPVLDQRRVIGHSIICRAERGLAGIMAPALPSNRGCRPVMGRTRQLEGSWRKWAARMAEG